MTATLTQQRKPTFTVNVGDYNPDPTGATDSTTAFTNAWNALKTLGAGTLYVPLGNYLTKDLLFQSFSNFTLRGDRGTTIWSSPNTVASPGQATHDVCIIADCTDFAVDSITFDARRDTVAADQFLMVNAASGQANITVQNGAAYVMGQGVSVFGGLTANGGTEKTFSDSNLKINSINGNVLTLSANLVHSYTGTGASGGATLTQYQTGGVVAYTIAGRTLGNEDAQNGLHLLNCQRFAIRNCVAQNTWESPIKMGVGGPGFPGNFNASTEACSEGIVIGNHCKHGYDQAISLWNGQHITVTANRCEDGGWGGVVFTHCNDCTATANVCINQLYTPPFDLNEGVGIAIEGGIRITLNGNVCVGNNSNGIRLTNSPLFVGSTTLSVQALGAATSLTINTATFIQANGSYTITDPNNPQIRENIFVAPSYAGGATVPLVTPLRNAYANGATIVQRYSEDCQLAGNICSQSKLSHGINLSQQINVSIVDNDCSFNGQNALVQGPSGIYVQALSHGAKIENNTVRGNTETGIVIDNLLGVLVSGNDCYNNGLVSSNPASPQNIQHGIKIMGVQDSLITNNKCFFNTGSGIQCESGNGSVGSKHTQILNNESYYNHQKGIFVDQGASMQIANNKAAFNSDANCVLQGVSNSIIAENVFFNSQGQEGLRLDDSGSVYCTNNIIDKNNLFDDQGTATQSWGLRELNHTSGSLITNNRWSGNTNAAQVTIAATSVLRNNPNYNPVGPLTAPGVPASGTAIQNTFNEDVMIFIIGGTISAIAVGNTSGSQTATGLLSSASGVSVFLAAGQWIKLTYTVAPTSWAWFGL